MTVIRTAVVQDLKQAAEIEQMSFGNPWSQSSFEQLLQKDNTVILVAAGDRIEGFCVLSFVFDEGEILNIAVLPEIRGTGIGRKLLQESVVRAKQQGVTSLLLEVRQSNHTAACFYQKNGFEKIGIRRDMYEKPRENGIVMKKTWNNR